MKSKKFLLLFILFCVHTILKAQPSGQIKLNQLGFYPGAAKIAVVTGDVAANYFYILSVNGKDTLLKGRLSKEKQSAYSATKTKIADFSRFQKKGTYVVYVPGAGSSYPFNINDNVNHAVAVATLKGYYYIRSDMPLEPQYAGKWARAAGHPDTAVLIHPSAASAQRPAGTKIATPGGWYDAGDYNKYVVNSGISTGTLLSAYEDFPAYFDTLKTNIPESSDAVPDILNEALYNLRWMLTMQDPNDGGVYNKCTNAAFDGMVMPGETKLPRYVVQKGTAAALDLAAVAAQASRIFKKYQKQLPGLSDSCLTAATKAWRWAQKNPAMEYNQNAINQQYQPKITTGAYGDKSFKDEWFWAAAELFATTANKGFYDTVSSRIADSLTLPSWGDVRMLGYYTLLRNKAVLPAYAAAMDQTLKSRLMAFADKYIPHVAESAFGTIMGQSKKDFIWGGNATAANEGIVLINAYLQTGNKKYIDYAVTNLDYLLGRNATGFCFVTGIGTKSTMHPHHRPSVADGVDDPVPGLLAGGPNPGRQDGCHYDFFEPETAYSDSSCAYASNEIAINWNAPMVYLANAIEALQKKAGYWK